MKTWKQQIRISDYSWLYNQSEKRTFCLIGKNFKNHNSDLFRIESYELLEVGKNNPIKISYEQMESLIENRSLIVL